MILAEKGIKCSVFMTYIAAVASLARGIGGDGHGYRAACHGSLLESGKNNAQKFA